MITLEKAVDPRLSKSPATIDVLEAGADEYILTFAAIELVNVSVFHSVEPSRVNVAALMVSVSGIEDVSKRKIPFSRIIHLSVPLPAQIPTTLISALLSAKEGAVPAPAIRFAQVNSAKSVCSTAPSTLVVSGSGSG